MTVWEMSATVGQMSTTVGGGGNATTVGEMSATGGGGGMPATVEKLKYALRNLRLEIAIHNSVYITSVDTWNNMSKAH